MKIEIINDGKGKFQSFEAKIEIEASTGMGFFISQFEAYGETEKEARDNLTILLNEITKKIKQVNETKNK